MLSETFGVDLGYPELQLNVYQDVMRRTSDILVPSIARTVILPKHIVVVFFSWLISILLPVILGR